MKKTILTFVFSCFISFFCIAQNVGINTSLPLSSLHISGNSDSKLLLENTTPYSGTVDTASMYFATKANNGNIQYDGAIKTLWYITPGVTNYARMGFFTGPSSTEGGLTERMSITPLGSVGIGTSDPLTTLDVRGSIYGTGAVTFGGALTVYDNISNTGNMFTDGYISSVGNMVSQGDISNLGNIKTNGNLTVSGGKGIVRSYNTTQLVMRTFAGVLHLTITNLAAGNYVDTGIFSYGTFSAAPVVATGNYSSGSGEWYHAIITPFNVLATSCKFRIFNPGPDALTMDATFSFTVTGQ